ncbi:unnamed protein product [Mytilus coruscus]|uniref:Uncharacterized protein n=1 Tax=Mytilus coruscus TaxID=42192 RepID=A0A6J8B501_MYTCO|nr:unnamed protein product [Mytilus coruscus]
MFNSKELSTKTPSESENDSINVEESRFVKQMLSMQSKFVDTLDKITKAHDKRNQLEQKFELVLTQKENLEKKLRAMEAKFEEKSLCKLCTNFEQEVNKCRQEKNSLQSKYADLFLEREVEVVKHETEIKIAKQKMDCSNSEIKVLLNQIKQYEERLHCKAISLLEMKHKVCEQRNEIIKLHEDCSLLKTQVNNKSDKRQSNLLTVSKSTNTESNIHQVDVASIDNLSNSTP